MPQPAGWKGGGGGLLKIWSWNIKKDIMLLGGPRAYGLRRWNREWPPRKPRPLCVVGHREGSCQSIGGRSIPTSVITHSGSVNE